jgi:hypothetical protein
MAERLEAQGSRSVVVGRDVINSIIVTGDHNQGFTGDYERLRDAYIEPWSVFERVDLDHFVGREWLLREVDAFLRDHDRGYFILEAEAGLGKTAFLAYLVKQRAYLHHFVELAPGQNGVVPSLKNLAAQLVLAYHLSPWEAEGLLPGAAARPDYLFRLLKLAADRLHDREKIVLVVDALDESGTLPRQNALGLPQVLPRGVFVIVSQRPVSVTLQVATPATPRHVLLLKADSERNRADVRRFLEQATNWPGVMQAMQSTHVTPEQFIKLLIEKSQGVWVYLHYLLHAIERGENALLDLDALPDGMVQYYANYWRRWRDEDEDKWYATYLPLLSVLAAVQEAITVEQLAEWANVNTSVQQIRRLLNERWRALLAITGQGQRPRYSFYHPTLSAFFDGSAECKGLTTSELAFIKETSHSVREAHGQIVSSYQNRYHGFWSELDAYGLRYLVFHTLRFTNASLSFDEYEVKYLALHLAESGRSEDIGKLIDSILRSF